MLSVAANKGTTDIQLHREESIKGERRSRRGGGGGGGRRERRRRKRLTESGPRSWSVVIMAFLRRASRVPGIVLQRLVCVTRSRRSSDRLHSSESADFEQDHIIAPECRTQTLEEVQESGPLASAGMNVEVLLRYR